MRCLNAFGERIAAEDPNCHTTETKIRVAPMNRFSALGIAEIVRMAWHRRGNGKSCPGARELRNNALAQCAGRKAGLDRIGISGGSRGNGPKPDALRSVGGPRHQTGRSLRPLEALDTIAPFKDDPALRPPAMASRYSRPAPGITVTISIRPTTQRVGIGNRRPTRPPGGCPKPARACSSVRGGLHPA